MFANIVKLTKEEMIERHLRNIKDRATRYQRGTTVKKYLLEDLESITREVEELSKVIQSDKPEYYV